MVFTSPAWSTSRGKVSWSDNAQTGVSRQTGIRNWKHLLLAEGHHQIGKIRKKQNETFHASNLTMSLQNVNPCEFFFFVWFLITASLSSIRERWRKRAALWPWWWSAKNICTKKRNMHKRCHVPIQRYHFDMQWFIFFLFFAFRLLHLQSRHTGRSTPGVVWPCKWTFCVEGCGLL